MRTDKRMLAALMINVAFAALELVGGALTGSAAVLSDAVHDFGDALSIALSYGLERKSRCAPNDRYTYGYARFSLLGALITSTVLLVGSVLVVWHAVAKFFTPTPVHYDGMIVLAIIGVLVNGGAVFFMRDGDSLNQRAVSLHMLEDVCGWGVALIGAFIMKFTDWWWIDPFLSVGVAVVLGCHAVRSLCAVFTVLLECAPTSVDTAAFVKSLEVIDGVCGVHHVHVWSLDGERVLASLHVVSDWADFPRIKEQVLVCVAAHGIEHATMQWDDAKRCEHPLCPLGEPKETAHGHYHHHHHAHG